MLLSLLYFRVRRLLGAGGRQQAERDIELLVLRHQVKVLQRQVKRPKLSCLDRVGAGFFAHPFRRSEPLRRPGVVESPAPEHG